MEIDVGSFIKGIWEGAWLILKIPGPEPYLIAFGTIVLIGGVVWVVIRLKNR